MKLKELIIFIAFINNISLAEDNTTNQQTIAVNPSVQQATQSSVPQAQIPEEVMQKARELPQKMPSLGTCDPYTDYFIYKCQPFKCRLPVGSIPGVTREIEVLGMEKDRCLHNYKFEVRNPHFTNIDLKVSCKLSERGRLEMSHQFTEYKKGNVKIYANPQFNQILSKECNAY